MATFEITVKASVEAADAEDAEEFMRELLEGDPVILDYHFVTYG